MCSFKKSLTVLAAVAAMTTAGGVHAALTNWYLDTNGADAGGLVAVADYLDLNGKSYVTVDATPSPTFTFHDAGIGVMVLADGSTDLPYALHTEFAATGTGNIDTGKVVFDAGGIVRFHNSANVEIATFTLLAGDGQLVTGTVLPNGSFSFISQAVSLAPGYFFDSAMNDLSAQVASGLVFSFLTTNAIYPVVPTTGDQAALATAYNGAFGTSLLASDIVISPTTLLISNNGQFRFDVPEPTSMALVGLGLSGLAALRRRKSA